MALSGSPLLCHHVRCGALEVVQKVCHVATEPQQSLHLGPFLWFFVVLLKKFHSSEFSDPFLSVDDAF